MQYGDIDAIRAIRVAQFLRVEHKMLAGEEPLVDKFRKIWTRIGAEFLRKGIRHKQAEPERFKAVRIRTFKVFNDTESFCLCVEKLRPQRWQASPDRRLESQTLRQ